MKKIFLLIVIIASITFCQSFKVDKVTGTVKTLDTNDNWSEVKKGTTIPSNSILVADKNSSVKISGEGIKFTLKESSAIPVSSIKKMTIDQLLLALAMEDMINAPRKKGNDNGKSTAVYGSKEGGNESDITGPDDFGIRRINGAVQLAENGFKESAIVTAKETFRKYPSTKKMANYRIYFADLLYDLGLNEEALDEFNSIKGLKLSDKEKSEVIDDISQINKKLGNR